MNDIILAGSDEIEDRVNNLVYGCKIFAPDSGPILVGMSGGIDSSVVAALYAAALGHKRVLGISMPTEFNTGTTKDSARQTAEELGIHFVEVPLQEEYERQLKRIEEVDAKVPGLQGEMTETVKQNVMPKIRFKLLSDMAGFYGGWYTCNANKTEIFFGYETLDGGLRGAVAPIGDLYKFQVKEVAEYLNNHVFKREVIPWGTIHKLEPSAELSADQNPDEGRGDPMYYPYHDFLARKIIEYRKGPETILGYYLAGTLAKELGIEFETIERAIEKRQRLVLEKDKVQLSKPAGFISDLEWAWNNFVGSYFKRVQAPPIFVVSKRGFGFDLRESIMKIDPNNPDSIFTDNYLRMRYELLRTA